MTIKYSTTKLPAMRHVAFYMGCDPEFFFTSKEKKVIGAEMVIPKDGLPMTEKSLNESCTLGDASKSKFIIDGVQAELNPRPNNCRANLANEIAACFKSLKKELDKKNAGIEVDFSQSVKIDKKELSKLDEKSQKFGCTPSLNSHKDTSSKLKSVDPLKYRNRSAGGHIHIGATGHDNIKAKIKKAPDEIVTMLDIICGNTCVLVDRDKGNAIRRKLYGRAGEYRLPPHGLEYRTLSNFWLTSYPLMSMAFALARTAVNLACDSTNGDTYIKAFTSAVDLKDIRKAINTNNFELAYANFRKVEPMLIQLVEFNYGQYAFGGNDIHLFHHFVDMIDRNGLGYWFKQDPLTHWTTLPEGHRGGITDFLKGTVADDMGKQKDLCKGKMEVA